MQHFAGELLFLIVFLLLLERSGEKKSRIKSESMSKSRFMVALRAAVAWTLPPPNVDIAIQVGRGY